jgi:SAM-dependent methyltransferase
MGTAPFSPHTLHAWSELSVASAHAVLPVVFALRRARSVVDVGCLYGAWAAVSRELGVDEVVGVDGEYVDHADLMIPAGDFLARDLARPLRLDRAFDLAISLEVAHYLPPARADGFVGDLCDLAPMVLFSAAIPHQGGVGHVNEQWPAYWAQRFAARAYTPLDCVRDEVWDDPAVASWYAQNTIVFCAPAVQSATITAHHGYGRCPARVHPATYVTYAGGRYNALRRRATRAVARLRRPQPRLG